MQIKNLKRNILIYLIPILYLSWFSIGIIARYNSGVESLSLELYGITKTNYIFALSSLLLTIIFVPIYEELFTRFWIIDFKKNIILNVTLFCIFLIEIFNVFLKNDINVFQSQKDQFINYIALNHDQLWLLYIDRNFIYIDLIFIAIIYLTLNKFFNKKYLKESKKKISNNKLSLTITTVFTSVMFGFIHFNYPFTDFTSRVFIVKLIYLTTIGLILALVRINYSIFMSIILHMMFNSNVAFSGLLFTEETDAYLADIQIIVTAWLVTCIVLYIVEARRLLRIHKPN